MKRLRNLILIAFWTWIRRQERRPGIEIIRLSTRARGIGWFQETKQIGQEGLVLRREV